jgi:hypothetical protein
MFTRFREWMQGNIEDRTSRLNPQMRKDLAAEVEASLAVDSSNYSYSEELITELNQTLDDSRALLSELEENELFLDTRIQSYRRRLDEMGVLSEDNGGAHTDLNLLTENTTSSTSALTERQQKQRECAQLLQGVVNTHKGLLADILLQKRRINYLERTRDDLLLKQKECNEFLQASKKMDAQQRPTEPQSSSDIEMSSVS